MKKGTTLELDIVDMAFGGKGIAKLPTENGEFIVFVNNSIPGQKVAARITKKKKRFAEAKLIKVLQPAAEETELPYQRIPGAPFAAWPIEKQRTAKEQSTLEMFKRLGEWENVEEVFEGYIASPKSWHYRNKMEYSFSSLRSELGTEEESWDFALGFKRRGQWWAVENLDADSGLFDEQLESQLFRIREFCEKTGLPAWDPAKSEGFFRFLVVRKSFAQDALLFNLVTTSKGLDQFDQAAFVDLLKDILGEDRLAGVLHSLNDEVGDAVKQLPENQKLLYGEPKVVEELLGLSFEISMQSFFQTNPACAELLYQRAIDYAEEAMAKLGQEGLWVMDLFCGTGTIAQLLSRSPKIQKIIGVDIVPEAIEDAAKNAARNNIEGIEFYAADVRKFLWEYPQFKQKIGVIVLDPPRGGIVPKALLRVIELEAPAIVYISCNPATQARDSLVLKEAGYEAVKLSLVDQFPHTSHIESVILYLKK
ncbi:23S rRNA (uracil(1939)-C(5))-methyltransferase RlmD [Saprospira sp. CCB-QB6]|uniref:23S rRNA (uracil(1939)-C(5))-methyltransferase RlmD n=1 Tax=Saprospira sp. CCB-QB6 TaxID=3023936 RepID=UPI00234A90CF|nr:23S rRNA (uracil(1939)-C(5))-methyltransferase RlmD [Saprospira sp. CCB-QB6]WCL81971.1 23S rRNA (uracil(1939)-C(5))-methyltransferase RlmD [Saprospira sp. CCB-QB6]